MSTGKEGKEIRDFEKTVKKRLIDVGKTQRWLTEEVNKKTGGNTGYAYVNKVIQGVGKDSPIYNAICEILRINP